MAAGDEILAWMKEVKKPIERTDCPVCEWALEKTERGLHCPLCGWTERRV